MTRVNETFTLLVDGKATATDVPLEEVPSLLSRYGVGREHTLTVLMQGAEKRVLGQNIRLVSSTGQGTKNPDIKPKPEPYDFMMDELKGRAYKFEKNALTTASAAALAATIGGVSYAVSWSFKPSLSITDISVPPSLEQAFYQIGGSPSLVSAAESLLTSSFFSGTAVVVGAIMCGYALLTQRLEQIFASVMVMGVPIVLSTVATAFAPEGERIESMSLPALERHLDNQDVPENDKAYVLAQAAIKNDVSSEWVPVAARQFNEGGYSFDVEPEVAYAIEAAAHGPASPALSDKSKVYAEQSSLTVDRARTIGFAALVVAGMVALLAAGKGLVALIIRRRLQRIKDMLVRL